MSQKKQVHLNLFLYGTGHHQAAWRAEDSAAEELPDTQYYIKLAQLAEKGLLDAVFFADGQAVSASAAQAGPTWFFEPVTLLSAISQCTTNIGLVCTISASFYSPFHAARMLGSLQHLSNGRAGINVVTSMWDTEAQNHSLTESASRTRSDMAEPQNSLTSCASCGDHIRIKQSKLTVAEISPIRDCFKKSITKASTSRCEVP